MFYNNLGITILKYADSGLYSANGAKLQNRIINKNGQVDKTTNYINGLYWYQGVYPDMLLIGGARFGIYPASFSGNPQIGQWHTRIRLMSLIHRINIFNDTKSDKFNWNEGGNYDNNRVEGFIFERV